MAYRPTGCLDSIITSWPVSFMSNHTLCSRLRPAPRSFFFSLRRIYQVGKCQFYCGKMLGADFRMLNTDCRMLGAGNFMLGAGFRMLNAKMSQSRGNQETSYFFDHLFNAAAFPRLEMFCVLNMAAACLTLEANRENSFSTNCF